MQICIANMYIYVYLNVGLQTKPVVLHGCPNKKVLGYAYTHMHVKCTTSTPKRIVSDKHPDPLPNENELVGSSRMYRQPHKHPQLSVAVACRGSHTKQPGP